jgi:glycosyltransferase involved in cell wall biosynthesis
VRVIKTESLDPARLFFVLGMRQYKVRGWQVPIKQTINFPDNKTPWAPFAYSAGLAISYDYILVTAPPFSAFITGYYLRRRTGKPLIVDFRDAWLEFPFMPYKGALQKAFVRNWERKIVDAASLVIVVDDNIKNTLLKKYPEVHEKICVIPNGYDPDDFMQTERPDVFTISYLGTIREERNPESVLRAVADFVAEHRMGNKDIKFRFMGHIEEHFLRRLEKYAFVETTGHLPYKKAINLFCNSHLAVLITAGSEYFFPSRQNEYLASGLPIIVCGKSKGLHMLDDAFKGGYPGWTFDFSDVEGMKKKIQEIYKKYRNGVVVKGKTPFVEYTRKKLTQQLAERLRKI